MDHRNTDYVEDWDSLTGIPAVRNMPRQKTSGANIGKNKKTKKPSVALPSLSVTQADEQDFDFSYRASRHEREWIVNSLGGFYEMHWLDDILHLVKGGKEANVYQCLANSSVEDLTQPYLAAKVYRPRRFRNLRKDHIYREGRVQLDGDGREIRDDGMLHAMQKKSNFGLELLHTSWIEHEVKTMEILAQAGCDIPRVFASGNNAILMTYIGDEDMAAPTLNSIDLDPDEAQPLVERVIDNVERMLAHNRIHADLSAYNILYWDGQITLIDFPQAIDPRINSNGFRIFERDLVRVAEYFAHQGARVEPHRLAAELWTSHGFRLTPDVHPRLLDDQDEADRLFWKKMIEAE